MGVAAAYPQYYPLYPVVHPIPYPQPYFPQPQPLGRSEDFVQPLEDGPTARYLVNFEAFQRVTGAFQGAAAVTAVAGVTAARPARTVTGTAAFYQNPFTGNKSKYKIILNGLAAGDNYHISLADDCSIDTAGVLAAPVNEVVGFYFYYALNL